MSRFFLSCVKYCLNFVAGTGCTAPTLSFIAFLSRFISHTTVKIVSATISRLKCRHLMSELHGEQQPQPDSILTEKNLRKTAGASTG